MFHKLINLIKKYSQCWTCLYLLIYMPWFFLLEARTTENVIWLNTFIDDWIPFCEYFIIPYYLWFLLVPSVVVFFLFRRTKTEYYQLSAMLFIGMTICLLICTFIPNGVQLRGFINGRKNIFTWLVSLIYHSDTNTNVFPSIHVYASLSVYIALCKTNIPGKYHWVRTLVLILAISITLSTVFLKQHCILDVLGAFALAAVMTHYVYHPKGFFSSDKLMTKTMLDSL